MAGLPQLYPYKSGPIEPVILPGETVGIWTKGTTEFHTVLWYEGIPRSDPLVVDLLALAAAAQSTLTQLLALEMPNNEFGQFRAIAIDDARFSMWQGRSDGRARLNTRVGAIDRFTNLFDPCGHQTEFYVFENNYMYSQALNTTGYALATSRIAFYGFRYVLQDPKIDPAAKYTVANPPPVYTRIPAMGHS